MGGRLQVSRRGAGHDVLNEIQINIGRTGAATPFAVLEPVNVGGAKVSFATLHNEDELRRKDLRVGDQVIVRRAGDVIPEVVGPVVSVRTGQEREWTMPANCPFCGNPIVRPPGEKVARCTGGYACPSRLREWLSHFASRGGMDIEGLGYKTIDLLLREKLINDPADIFLLAGDQLLGFEGWGEISVAKLMNGIEAARHRPLRRVLMALGIRHVGGNVGQGAGTPLPEPAGADERPRGGDRRDRGGRPGDRGFGQRMVERPRQHRLGCKTRIGRRHVSKTDRWRARRRRPRPTCSAGISVVVTGTLASMSREEAEAAVAAAGRQGDSGVSKKTTYLVAGPTRGPAR